MEALQISVQAKHSLALPPISFVKIQLVVLFSPDAAIFIKNINHR